MSAHGQAPISDFNAARTTAGKTTAPSLPAFPPAYVSSLVVSVHHVEHEDSKLLTSLAHVFGHSEPSRNRVKAGLAIMGTLKQLSCGLILCIPELLLYPACPYGWCGEFWRKSSAGMQKIGAAVAA